jgi:hypothetical protein
LYPQSRERASADRNGNPFLPDLGELGSGNLMNVGGDIAFSPSKHRKEIIAP